jgi:hypothetical protein
MARSLVTINATLVDGVVAVVYRPGSRDKKPRLTPFGAWLLCTIDSKTTGTSEAVPALFERERLERFERLRRFLFDR